MADRFDEDPLDDTDRDGDTLRIMGISHSLLWQVIPFCVPFAKLGEAANDAATFIDPDGGLAGYDWFIMSISYFFQNIYVGRVYYST